MPFALNAEPIRAARSLPLSICRCHGPFTACADVLLPRVGTSKDQIGCTMLRGSSLRNEGQDMSLLSLRHFRSLVIVLFLAAILAFPASAQTGSDSTGPAGAPAQTEATGGPASSNPAIPKTEPNAAGSDAAAPSTTNSTAPKAESEPVRLTAPIQSPAQGWFGHPYQHQQSKTKNDGFFRWDTKI